MANIELLAPAQNLDVGRAAIDSGADAVYIGAPRFGARARAGNSLQDIAALVRHAHTYWARVYVTVNTLVVAEKCHPCRD
jgi:collagenase-like PrtC family protease